MNYKIINKKIEMTEKNDNDNEDVHTVNKTQNRRQLACNGNATSLYII